MTHELLDISAEVADALDAGRPVVALESNLITHGLAYPANVETATAVEQAVRAGGAVPATVCLDGGRLKVGMTAAEIERFGAGSGIPKASSRDLPVLLARGGPGATTIAATLVVADLAGIAFL
ncbi:MAG: pseudouridylate synthase, partial [Pseudonocardiales bacterium]|nr:pseudouridylate synthase [Pseudonocardiales bacterium]